MQYQYLNIFQLRFSLKIMIHKAIYGSAFDIFSFNDNKTDFNLLYRFRDASTKPYGHSFKHQTFDVIVSFGGKIKSSRSISSPCKKAVFISIKFIFHSV